MTDFTRYMDKYYELEIKYSGDILVSEPIYIEHGKTPKIKDNSFGFTEVYSSYELAVKAAIKHAHELQFYGQEALWTDVLNGMIKRGETEEQKIEALKQKQKVEEEPESAETVEEAEQEETKMKKYYFASGIRGIVGEHSGNIRGAKAKAQKLAEQLDEEITIFVRSNKEIDCGKNIPANEEVCRICNADGDVLAVCSTYGNAFAWCAENGIEGEIGEYEPYIEVGTYSENGNFEVEDYSSIDTGDGMWNIINDYCYYFDKVCPEATTETAETVEETAEQETEINAEVEAEQTAENITVSGTNQDNINVLIVADIANTFETITHTGYFDTS